MTLAELKERNPDVVLDEVSWEELDGMASGAVLFYASLAGGSRPKEERQVLWAGYVLTQGLSYGNALTVVRMTNTGGAKVTTIGRTEDIERQRAALFRTRPLPSGDPRAEAYRVWA